MVALVSLSRVKQALRIDHTDDDDLLDTYIEAASERIIEYLKDQAAAVIPMDSGGDLALESGEEVNPVVQVATIQLVGQFYREPDGNAGGAFGSATLPKPVTALLYMLRDPSVA